MESDYYSAKNCELLVKEVTLLRQRIDHELKTHQTYNVFNVIRKSSDEVNLHSKILADLLDPAGSHLLGNIFLKSFLEIAGIKYDPNAKAIVIREHNSIDIFIKIDNHAIIVENKIHASDQDRQLARYYEYCESKDFKPIDVIYLSLDGHDPSKISLGEKLTTEQIITLSYKYDINEWLEKCIYQSATFPELRETLVQYREIVKNISGRFKDMKHENELVKILLAGQNLRSALMIRDGIGSALASIQRMIWEQIYEGIEKSKFSFGIHNGKDWRDEDAIEKFYRNEKGNRYYGLSIHVEHISDDFHVEHRIEIEHSIYHGFIVVDQNGEAVTSNGPEFSNYRVRARAANVRYNRGDNQTWLGWCYEPTNSNLLTFSDENAQSLLTEKGRAEYVKTLLSEVFHDIQEFKKSISSGKE